jgi:hypothetical protein|tara:strand:- start:1255 stop:1479 length:225 start_codon:yes stop_codon:yes gene_type:complete
MSGDRPLKFEDFTNVGTSWSQTNTIGYQLPGNDNIFVLSDVIQMIRDSGGLFGGKADGGLIGYFDGGIVSLLRR